MKSVQAKRSANAESAARVRRRRKEGRDQWYCLNSAIVFVLLSVLGHEDALDQDDEMAIEALLDRELQNFAHRVINDGTEADTRAYLLRELKVATARANAEAPHVEHEVESAPAREGRCGEACRPVLQDGGVSRVAQGRLRTRRVAV